MGQRIKDLNTSLSRSINNEKAYAAENSLLKNDNIAFKFEISQLNHLNDSLINKMQEVIADRNIKMKQVKTMQYLLENIKKQDTIFIKDTIFINKDFVLDTCKIDEWSEICLHLEYPNIISVDATFNNEKYITTSVRKEPIKQRKWFLPRWFTRKQEIITIDVYDKNPYVKTPQQRYVEIIK
jgi:hypothetical protein